MASSVFDIENEPLFSWFPSPESWGTYECTRCSKSMRQPFRPSDGLCSDCRKAEEEASAPALEERLVAAGTPQRYARFTRASWERRYGAWKNHPDLRRLVGWPTEHDDRSWLVLVTSPGHGERKTGLATAILGEAIEQGLPGRWLSQSGWLRDLKASWTQARRGGESEAEVWSRAADARVLVFDDLGGVEAAGAAKAGKPWWAIQVAQLLRERESRLLPTIVTAGFGDWRRVGELHSSLVLRMDTPLRIKLPPRRE